MLVKSSHQRNIRKCVLKAGRMVCGCKNCHQTELFWYKWKVRKSQEFLNLTLDLPPLESKIFKKFLTSFFFNPLIVVTNINTFIHNISDFTRHFWTMICFWMILSSTWAESFVLVYNFFLQSRNILKDFWISNKCTFVHRQVHFCPKKMRCTFEKCTFA